MEHPTDPRKGEKEGGPAAERKEKVEVWQKVVRVDYRRILVESKSGKRYWVRTDGCPQRVRYGRYKPEWVQVCFEPGYEPYVVDFAPRL